MTERSDLRAAGDGDMLVFHDHHLPRLRTDAEHRITVRQTLALDKDRGFDETVELRIRVSGPQVVLPKGSVVATFPADLSSGAFAAVLPHVTLSRGTLPWERAAMQGDATPRPWMVLLLLDDGEMAGATVSATRAANLPAAIAHGDAAADAPVSVLDLDATLVADRFPTYADLPWLAHVRHIAPGGGADETATVVASRLPAAGRRNHAFLLSVEHRYTTAGIATGGAARAVFPILHRWSFVAEDQPRHGFAELLTMRHDPNGRALAEELVPTPFALTTGPAESADQRAAGMVPVRHMLRNGDLSAAWYHGPLLPGRPPYPEELITKRLPADHADDLMLLDQGFGIFDVSYAAAWELGRMIVLEHTDIATALHAWKRGFAQDAHRLATAPPIGALHAAQRPAVLPHLPGPIEDWIRRSLLELREVPFVNLVPDEDLLPEGAFRFFDVDPLWLDALRDGAISVGRTDSRTREVEHDLRRHLDPPGEMSGFLLRNGVVSDFPGLEVDGYGTDAPEKGRFDKPALQILRMDRLARSLLLVIFAGRVRTVDLHLHPQALHFGFEHEDDGGVDTYAKTVTTANLAGAAKVSTGDGMNDERRIDMPALAKQFGLSDAGSGHVGAFAARMLEGVPLVRFTRGVEDGA